ncbi:MAG: hypothetical protein GC190_21070 [Alphaproteobacteria bacterium]|nr:hypothetical protein [Alphaproteobacteria bacterium]
MSAPIYELLVDTDYVGLSIVDQQHLPSLESDWVGELVRLGTPIEVQLDDAEADPEIEPVPDYVSLWPGCACFSIEAWGCLRQHLDVPGRTVSLALATKVRSRQFVLFDPSSVVERLDFEKSDVQFFSSSPRKVRWVENITFHASTDPVSDIFRERNLRSALFCSERCRRVLIDNAFTGYLFKQLPISP